MADKQLRQHRISRYGWLPDVPDMRDHLYAAPMMTLGQLPPKVDLRPQCPPPYDQGQLGSCTGNSIAGAIQFDRAKQKVQPDFVPSRLFIYYNERKIEGTIGVDSGAQIRDGIKAVATLGVCREDTTWPYDVTKFTAQPPDGAFQEALQNRALSYSRVARTLQQMKGCLASGYPFVFGFTVYDGFESDDVAKSGVVPMPASTETSLGGHAVLAVGYDDPSQRFVVRNSWGPGWGQAGYFTIPYAYLLDDNLSDDFWTIRIVGQ